MKHSYRPIGPFDLLYQNQYFNGWPLLADNKTIVMTFPVEGWHDSAVVTLGQSKDNIEIETFNTNNPEKAIHQALTAMSLDIDATQWPKVGLKDKKVGELQDAYHCMRPTLFHSPYEAAAAFIIGHRITIAQTRKIRMAMSESLGKKIIVGDTAFYAFPDPSQLLTIQNFAGLSDTKIYRLHGIAQAALDGLLDREYLRSLPQQEALVQLEKLTGIGPFFSQGILFRGAGIANGLIHDDMTYHAIKVLYELSNTPTQEQVENIAKTWEPYRSWVIVLMHVWLRETNNYPKRTFSNRR